MQTATEHGWDADTDKGSRLRFLKELLDYPALAYRHKALLYNFYRREFHGRFRGSILGMFWVLMHPIFMFLTYYLAFGVLFASRNLPVPMHYPLYLFLGIIAWMAFAETTIRATTLVVENGNLIQKVAFPAQLLPLHLLAVNTIVYLVGGLIVLIIAVAVGWPVAWFNLLGLPYVLLVQSVFALGLSLFLAAAFVFLRDLSQVYPIFMTFWFFASPIFWHRGMLSAETYKSFAPYLELNPIYHLVSAHRAAFGLGTEGMSFSSPEVVYPNAGLWDVLAYATAALPWAIVALVIGFVTFRSVQHRFADEV